MFFSVLIGKILILFGKIFHKGSSKPGAVVLKMNRKFFKNVTLPKKVIAVTGSSGKGSISSMIAEIYRKSGKKVAHNSKGANLSAGIATLILENCTLSGKIKKDVLIYEVDERFAKNIFGTITPNYVVISNICRDQPPRQGHFDIVYDEINKALTKDMHLILNGDDPYLQKYALEGFDVTYFGMAKNKYSYTDKKFNALNINYCPKCGKKLIYDYYQFETLGNYHCENCDFKRPHIDYEITDLDYETGEMIINNVCKLKVPFNILYAAYNTAAAFTMAGVDGLELDKVTNIIGDIKANEKLNIKYDYQTNNVYVLSNKNENSSTFNQSVLFASRNQKLKTILVGWKEISRRYTFNDLSWLYDIEFELLNDKYTEKIVCVGENGNDIALRMKYAGFDEDQIEVYEKLEDAVKHVKETAEGDIYAIVNFDYVEPFNKLMKLGDKRGN